MESLYVDTSPFRDERDCWRSSTQNWGRHVCGTVAVGSGWKLVGGVHGMLLLAAKYSGSRVWREDTERRCGALFKGPILPFGSLVDYHPISTKDQSRIHQFGKKVLPGIFLGFALYAEKIWKGDILVAGLEELEEMDASEIHAKRLNAKEVMLPKSGEEFIFPVADGTVKPFGGDRALKTSTLIRNQAIRRESHHDFLGESEGSPLAQHFQFFSGFLEAQDDFWSISGDCIHCHHVEPRVKLYTPREESCLVPLKYIDVTRATKITLDVIQESRIDDYWNIDVSKDLSDSWTGFTQFTLLKEKASRRIHVVREQIDQTANNIKAWSPSVRNLEKYVKKLKNEGESKIERQVKNQSSTMSEDFEVFISLNLRMRNSRRSSKVHGDNWKSQRRLLGFVKGWMAESTGRPVARMMNTSQNWPHCRKRESFCTTLQFGTQTHSDASSDENTWSKCSSGQKMRKNLRKYRRGIWRKSETNLTWSTKQEKKDVKVHFASSMDLCHLKNTELEKKHQKF